MFLRPSATRYPVWSGPIHPYRVAMPYQMPERPVVQLALDFLNLDHALRVAQEAAQAGPLWIEAGTPLIKSEGLAVIRALRASFPSAVIIADTKTMDAGRTEVEAAQKAGADIVTVLAAAADETIRECVTAGRHVGAAIFADLCNVADPVKRAVEVAALGVDIVGVHLPIDRQMAGEEPFEVLRAVAAAVSIPVACAGGITPANAAKAAAAGGRVIIIGGAITKAPDARAAALAAIENLAKGISGTDTRGTRLGFDRIREIVSQVSTPNLSDAMHRGGAVLGFTDRNPGHSFCGPVVTVLTVPGDWSKPVQAIDAAAPGSVLVIDAGGMPPAVWGGLATLTAVKRGLAGVIIQGACRDLEEIQGSALGLWSSAVCPNAGEAKGIGSIGAVLHVGGQTIANGDWIVADASGIVAIPAQKLVEVANRAMDVKEREEQLTSEIQSGRTLSQIAQLLRWEAKR